MLGSAVALALVALCDTGGSRGQAPASVPGAGDESAVEIIRQVDAATDKALDYLERVQSQIAAKSPEKDGAWHDNHAMNALAILAFLSSGHVPGRGKYGDTIEEGVRKPGVLTRGRKFLLSTMGPNGFINGGDPRMYAHGLSTLALAELYGMDPDEEVEKKLRLAVDVIVKNQTPAGGWGYAPVPNAGQDMSITVMQIVALRAANNAEVPVPKETFDRAIKYVLSCAGAGGGYGYQGPGASPQTSAGGTLSMQLLGKGDDKTVQDTIGFLQRAYGPIDQPLNIGWGAGPVQYFYYFHYYAIQGQYQHGGDAWARWHPAVRKVLLANQNPDGSWDVPPGTAEAGLISPDNKVYSTALATLILNIYKHYLPAYQR
jgi:hypothetical protein